MSDQNDPNQLVVRVALAMGAPPPAAEALGTLHAAAPPPAAQREAWVRTTLQQMGHVPSAQALVDPRQLYTAAEWKALDPQTRHSTTQRWVSAANGSGILRRNK